jgi:hypothetical protein
MSLLSACRSSCRLEMQLGSAPNQASAACNACAAACMRWKVASHAARAPHCACAAQTHAWRTPAAGHAADPRMRSLAHNKSAARYVSALFASWTLTVCMLHFSGANKQTQQTQHTTRDPSSRFVTDDAAPEKTHCQDASAGGRASARRCPL